MGADHFALAPTVRTAQHTRRNSDHQELHTTDAFKQHTTTTLTPSFPYSVKQNRRLAACYRCAPS